MGTQIDRLVDEHFKELKKRCSLTALDENSKKVEKRKSLDCNLLTGDKAMHSLAEPRSWDLKSVKVLVERTKFNEMQVIDLGRNAQSPVKIHNGTLHNTQQKRRRVAKKKTALAVAPQRPSIDEHFRARRCYVKVPKDKQLIKLLHTESLADEKKRSRGRPKKQKKVYIANEESSPAPSTVEHAASTQSTSNNLKRKHTETPDAATQSKRIRRNKSSEFFISIDSLICSPSPRRRSTKLNSPEEIKQRSKKLNTVFSLVTLRHKFGKRFFKSYVKVKRHREQERSAVNEIPVEGEIKKKKKGKNLSVSFLETVEIFGESSDGEDWLDYDEPSFSGKTSRLKRLDNDDLVDNEFTRCPVTSTPFTTSRTGQNADKSASSTTNPDGSPKRKEKISFSPLKEDDPSPRKEQLKLANEKIVRFSLEEQPAEEDEPDSVSPSSRLHTSQSELTKAQDTDAAAAAGEGPDEAEVDGERQETPIEVKASEDAESVALETELITPPPSEDKNAENPETVEHDDDGGEAAEPEKDTVAGENEEEDLENKTTNLEEGTNNTNDEISRTTPSDDKEGADSFESAVDVPNEEEAQNAPTDDDPEVIANDIDKVIVEGDGTEVDFTEEESRKGTPNSAEEAASRTKADLPEERGDNEEDLISETTNQVNISNCSDQQFEDASELIATVPLTEPLGADQTEVDAVLDDVCQLVVDETNTLLPEHNDDEFVSPHNVSTVIDDDVDDFTSVLTHPEVERSLQSAASSTLVPNSQEIVVAAAVSSQAAIVPPPDVDVTEDTFASVVAEVERFTKDVNPEIYSDSVGITGTDVMMDNVQVRHSLDDIFDDDVDDDIISSLRMSSGSIDICHDKNLPIQVIETEVMAIPNEPDIIFDKPLGTTASILGTSMTSSNDTLNTGCGHSSTASPKLSLGRIFQSVKSYVMSPKDKHTALKD